MVYDPDTPANAAEDPSQSQPKITANFQELNTFLSVNHVALNDADQGKHKWAMFPEQVAAPVTGANEAALYTKAVSAVTQLFYADEGAGTERQISFPTQTTAVNAGTAGGNLTYMDTIFGVRIIWGLTATGTGGRTVVTPAGSGAVLGYSALANDAGSAVTGATAAGAGPPDTITIYSGNSISIRYIIYTQIA